MKDLISRPLGKKKRKIRRFVIFFQHCIHCKELQFPSQKLGENSKHFREMCRKNSSGFKNELEFFPLDEFYEIFPFSRFTVDLETAFEWKGL